MGNKELDKLEATLQITVSSIHAACREREVPMTLDDVAAP